MNKKLFSAALFGALLLGTASTFVSCKDYDDDIQNLQTQITANKDAIAQLQTLVGSGSWVSSINPIENGFVVNMSNGQSVTVTGINGKDGANGKNGTEWTIGEDGMWYKDGVVTEFKAVATDGKDGENGAAGVAAPSPTIDANGMWVIYEYDEETGKYVAKTTEISAKGTSAFVVNNAGNIELNVADETGKFQTITLPATSNSLVAEAPFTDIRMDFETATWAPTTTNKFYQKIAAKFPEVTKIEKNAKMKQGGYLPVLINPGNVVLTNKCQFSLQFVDGTVAPVKLSNPQKGLVGARFVTTPGGATQMVTRATEDNFWTLEVEPELVNGSYASFTGQPASLVIVNEAGAITKTTYAYKLKSNPISAGTPVDVNPAASTTPNLGTAHYAPAIDLFATVTKKNIPRTPIELENEYEGYYIIELTEALQIEKYGLSIAEDGKTLKIANMPANETSMTVNMDVTALGLNGTAITKPVIITVAQAMEVVGSLPAKPVTLAKDSYGSTTQSVLWDMADLKFSATQLNELFGATLSVTVTDKEDNTNTYTVPSVLKKKADGTTNATGYADWAKMGFNLNATNTFFVPGEYTVTFKFTKGTTELYSANADLTVANPTVSSLFSTASASTVDGVLTVVGAVSGDIISYTLSNGVVLPAGNIATLVGFEDLDHSEWLESMGSATEAGAMNWVDATGKLNVYKYGVKAKDVDPDTPATMLVRAGNVATTGGTAQHMIGKTRKIRGTYKLFGNAANKVTYDFKVKVVSPIFNADPAKAISYDPAKMTVKLGKTLKLSEVIQGIYAAGKDTGKKYNLYTVTGTPTPAATYVDYSDPKYVTNSSGVDLVIDANGLMVKVDLNDMAKLGYSADDIEALQSDPTKVKYLEKGTVAAHAAGKLWTWGNIWYTIKGFFNEVDATGATVTTPGNGVGYVAKEEDETGAYDATTATADQKMAYAMFTKYAAKIEFPETDSTITTTPTAVKGATEIASAVFDFVNSADAANYATIASNGNVSANSSISLASWDGSAKVRVKLTIIDKWGMKMVHEFDVTVTQ